jgi:N-acetylglucosaminyldiphosphoundecaprenol N-acetyl-beta-D-mannosaminyltransferase
VRVGVKGVGFDAVTPEQAMEKALALSAEDGCKYVVTPNPEIVWLARKQPELRDALNGSDLVIPDGIGIIYASRILGEPLPSSVPGIELAAGLLLHMAEQGEPVYLLGAKPGVAERAAENLKAQYPGLNIVGTGDGYFQEDGPVISRINACKPRLMLVCLGFPRQELWMAKHRHELDVGLMVGLGGSLDVFAGDVKRAPDAWCRLNLEWFYRLLHQPSRLGRMMKLPVFLLSVVWERLRHGKTDRV